MSAYYEQLQSVIDPDAITSLKEQISCSFMSLPVVHQSCKALDKSISDPYKMELKQCFIDWCFSDVKKVLDKREEFHSLQTSIIKEVHTKWRIKTHSDIEKRKDTIISGLKQTGILEYNH